MENETTLSTSETIESILTTDRPFFTTPIDAYSVTEGLLLLLLLLLVFGWLWKQMKEVF